jgi:hypothetical protein
MMLPDQPTNLPNSTAPFFRGAIRLASICFDDVRCRSIEAAGAVRQPYPAVASRPII